VDQDPDASFDAAVDLELARAQQGDVGDARLAGGLRRVGAVDVGRRGEDDRDEVVLGQLVAREDPLDQLLGPLDEVGALVPLQRGGAAQGTDRGVGPRVGRWSSRSSSSAGSGRVGGAGVPLAAGAGSSSRPVAPSRLDGLAAAWSAPTSAWVRNRQLP
jgi:hypothetical protein